MSIKQNIPELSLIAARIAQLSEQIREVVETNDKVQELKVTIKELQEEVKAALATDSFYNELTEELKEKKKELAQGAKTAVAGTDVAKKNLIAYLTAAAKNKEQEVILKGSQFNVIRQLSGNTYGNAH